jgi:TonB family protein
MLRFHLPRACSALLLCAAIAYSASMLPGQATTPASPPAASQPAGSPAMSVPTDPKERLIQAFNSSTLDTIAAGPLKPWHLKVDVQMYDEFGTHPQSATIEEWRGGIALARVTYTTPDYVATMITNPDGTFRTSGKGLVPFLLAFVRSAIIHPQPSQAKLATATRFDSKSIKAGKAELDCVTPIYPAPAAGAPPSKPKLPPLPPATYCMEPDSATLLVIERYDSLSTVRQRIATFQQRYVPVELSIGSGPIVVATAKIEQLSTMEIDPELFKPAGEVRVPFVKQIELADKIVAGSILKHEPITYPVVARERHIQGTVTITAIIGTDGHIYAAFPLTSPDPSLTSAALSAVRQYTYKPFTLNGEPVEVRTVIRVNFTM